MSSLVIDGIRYEVVEVLGYVHGKGWSKVVATPEGERVASKISGRWQFTQPTISPRGPIAGQDTRTEPIHPVTLADYSRHL